MKYLILMLAALLIGTPAAAGVQYGTIGGFMIWMDDDDPKAPECLMARQYDGPGDSRLLISTLYDEASGLSNDGLIVGVMNRDWSIVDGRTYPDLRMLTDNISYGGEGGRGIISDDLKGFSMQFNIDALTQIARTTSLMFMRGNTVVDHFNMTGSAAAVASFRRCMRDRAARITRDRASNPYSHIERDPFSR